MSTDLYVDYALQRVCRQLNYPHWVNVQRVFVWLPRKTTDTRRWRRWLWKLEDALRALLVDNAPRIVTGCRHQHEVWSPIDTVEVCVKCGDRRPCPPLIEQQRRV